MIVRREVSAQGRSRAFVDGALATSGALRDVGGRLVDLHGQHEHQVLLDPAAHLDLLDEFAGADAERDRGGATLRALAATSRRARSGSLSGERQKASRAEFLTFQLAEIDRVERRQPGEDEELTATRQRARQRRQAAAPVRARPTTALYEGDEAALPALGTVWKRVGELGGPRRRGSRRTWTRGRRSSRSSRISRSSCVDMPRASTRLRRVCRRSRIVWRSSNV